LNFNPTIEAALRKYYFYSGLGWDQLPPSERRELEFTATRISLKKKKILSKQGGYPNGIYIVLKGKLKIYQQNPDGSIQILFIYGRGEVFGYRPILCDEYNPVTTAAIEDSELMFIERKHFLEHLHHSLILSNLLLRSLSHEFSVLTNWMNVIAQKGIKERLSLSLMILHKKFSIDTPPGIDVEIKLTRTDLADLVGTSLENLVRSLNVFKEKGLVRVNGKGIILEQPDNLFRLAAIGLPETA
jgi:CRP-like cAMP-binding protein